MTRPTVNSKNLPAPKKRLWKGLFRVVEPVVVVVLLLSLSRDGVLLVTVVVWVVGALDRYFCFISSAVKVAPVVRTAPPDPVELSDPVLESEEALLPVGVWVSDDVLLLKLPRVKKKCNWNNPILLPPLCGALLHTQSLNCRNIYPLYRCLSVPYLLNIFSFWKKKENFNFNGTIISRWIL